MRVDLGPGTPGVLVALAFVISLLAAMGVAP